jgi:hypothetical protein
MMNNEFDNEGNSYLKLSLEQITQLYEKGFTHVMINGKIIKINADDENLCIKDEDVPKILSAIDKEKNKK